MKPDAYNMGISSAHPLGTLSARFVHAPASARRRSRRNHSTSAPAMSQANYNLDRSITAFFSSSQVSATREQCDEFARREFGGLVCPVSLKGMASYTVTAGPDKVVQFREQTNLLDERIVALARAAHPDVVASCTFHGLVSGSRSEPEVTALGTYSMSKLPGTNYIFIRSSLAESLPLQLATVNSLARFVRTVYFFDSKLICPKQTDYSHSLG